MSTPYTPGYGQPPNYTARKVNYGWIGESWDLYRNAWLAWGLLFLLPIAFYAVTMVVMFSNPQIMAIISQARGGAATPGAIPAISPGFALLTNLLSLAQWPIMFVVACCGSDMALRQVRGERVAADSIFRGMRNGVQMVLFGLLGLVAAIAGFIACCIGVYVSYGLLLPGIALVADGVPATTAFSRSVEGMKGDWLNSALFIFVFGLLGGLGTLLTCYLGAFVFYPMWFIITALAYRDMIGIPVAQSPWQADSGPQAPGSWPPSPSSMQQPGSYGQQPGQYGQQQPTNQQPFGQPPTNQSPFGQPPASDPNEPRDPDQEL